MVLFFIAVLYSCRISFLELFRIKREQDHFVLFVKEGTKKYNKNSLRPHEFVIPGVSCPEKDQLKESVHSRLKGEPLRLKGEPLRLKGEPLRLKGELPRHQDEPPRLQSYRLRDKDKPPWLQRMWQWLHTAKTQYKKFESNIPRKGTALLPATVPIPTFMFL